MRKLSILTIWGLIVLFSSTFYAQRINWGEDPVNLAYNGTPGKILIKVLYNPWVETQGASKKWTKGFAGNGQVFDIDSAIYYSNLPISEGIALVCGNPTKFLNNLDRSKIEIVFKNQSLAFKPKDGKDGRDGKDGYTPIKGVDYFDGQDGRDGKDAVESSGFPWWQTILAVVAGGALVYLGTTIDNGSDDENKVTPPDIWTNPPSGKPKQSFQFQLRTSF